MLSFKVLVSEQLKIDKNDQGDVNYEASLSPSSKIRINFFHRGNSRYTAGISRLDQDDQGNFTETDKLSGRTKIPLEQRHLASMHLMHALRHFIKNTSPHEIIASGNTRFKRKSYKQLFDIMKSRYPGSDTSHSDVKSVLRFPPTPEVEKSIQTTRNSNLEKIRAIAAKKQTAQQSI